MPELSNHLTFISDPGHGWLKVPLTEIVALGLETQISVYSYIEGRYAYLKKIATAPLPGSSCRTRTSPPGNHRAIRGSVCTAVSGLP